MADIKPYAGGRMSGWPKGMDNLKASFDILPDTLRDAVNVDVLTSGRVRRRRGITQEVADAGAHSLFSDGTKLVWATAGALKTSTANFSPRTVLSDPLLAAPLSYVALHGEVYFSNEDVNGKLNLLGDYEPWGIVPPTAAPTCVSGGGDRIVQVTCVFVSATGEESGAPLAVAVATDDDALITASNIPQSSDVRVVATRIYATGIDGMEFFQEVDVPTGTTTAFLRGPYGTGLQLKTQLRSNPPPGQLLEYYNACIWVAAGNVLWHTSPLRYGMYDPKTNFYMFPERITMLKAGTDGLYVSSDKTYHLSGVPGAKPSLDELLPYKAIEGAAAQVPNSTSVVWLSERGVVLAQGKEVKNLTEDRIAMDTVTRACLGFVERDGAKHVVTIAKDSVPNPLVSTDFRAVDADQDDEVR